MFVLSLSVGSYASTSTAAYASTAPVIDGVIDSVWDTTVAQECSGTGGDWQDGDVTAYSKILWDETAVYYLVVVNDSTKGSNFETQSNDCINMWISETNTGSDSFDTDVGDYLYMVTSKGLTLKDFGAYVEFEYNVELYNRSEVGFTESDNGYIVEVKIPYMSGITPEAGYLLGYTISVNDDRNDDGVRDSYVHSATNIDNGGSGSSYWSKTSDLGEIEFLAKTETDVPDTAEPVIEPDIPAAPLNPSTSDISVLPYLFAAAASAGCLLIKKIK